MESLTNSKCFCACNSCGSRIFGEGAQRSFDPKGGLSLNFAQNRGFPLKFLENCMILGARGGPGPKGPPGSAREISGAT